MNTKKRKEKEKKIISLFKFITNLRGGGGNRRAEGGRERFQNLGSYSNKQTNKKLLTLTFFVLLLKYLNYLG